MELPFNKYTVSVVHFLVIIVKWILEKSHTCVKSKGLSFKNTQYSTKIQKIFTWVQLSCVWCWISAQLQPHLPSQVSDVMSWWRAETQVGKVSSSSRDVQVSRLSAVAGSTKKQQKMGKLQAFEITLKDNKVVYSPGESISGTVNINPAQPIQCTGRHGDPNSLTYAVICPACIFLTV